MSLPPNTYSVSELGKELQFILSETLSGVWVAGEVRRPTRSRAGHLYFELVEKGAGDGILGSIQVALFRRDLQRVQRVLARAGIDLEEGQSIRCFGGVDFYPSGGRLQLIARDVDPLFSLGDLAQRRLQTLQELTNRGLRERNAGLRLPQLPLKIALLTSEGSAASRDFVATLQESPYAFEVLCFDVAVQGPGAETQIVRALDSCSALSRREIELVVLIRGGGSKTDLATFDSLAVAEAIALCPLPVLTGLGHEIDEAVADLVSHRAFKTPTAVAEFLCQEVSASEQQLERLARRLAQSSQQRLHRVSRSFAEAELRVFSAGRRLERTQDHLRRLAERLCLVSLGLTREGRRAVEGFGQRLQRSARPSLRRARTRGDETRARLLTASSRALDGANHSLAQRSRWVEQLSPARTLRRGFSVTRDAKGRVVRSVEDLIAGEELSTQLAEGRVRSRVTATFDSEQA